jgi:hypothetical protein
MKTVILASLLASAAAFAPASQTVASSTALSAFKDELGAQVPLGYFDPIGLTKDGDQATFDRLRYVELKHGRIAMMAVLGQVRHSLEYLPQQVSPLSNSFLTSFSCCRHRPCRFLLLYFPLLQLTTRAG